MPLCVLLGCLLTALSVAATWVKLTAFDTNTYLDTVVPLIKDEKVSEAVATRVVDKVFAKVDVGAVVEQALPDRASALAVPLVAVIQRYAVQLLDGIIQSKPFQAVWADANRIAHTQIVKLLRGELVSGQTEQRAHEVVLDLSGVVQRLDTGLQQFGIDLFPSDSTARQTARQAGEFVVAKQSQLEDIRLAVKWFDRVAFVLPILALAFFLLAIWLSWRRARTVMWIGLGTVITFAVLAIVLRVERRRFIGSIEDPLTRSAADSIWSHVFHGLRAQVVLAVVLALLVAFAGWFMGGSRAATGGRQSIREHLARLRHGDAAASPGGFARFVARFRRPIQLASVGVAIAVLLNAPKATFALVLLAALIVVVVLVLVEVIAGPAPPAAGDEPSAPAEP